MRSLEKEYQAFLQVLDYWKAELECYSEEEITADGTANCWSIGQVYMHLIEATLNFQGKQFELCIYTDFNAKKLKNTKAMIVFYMLKKFPPVKIKVPASVDYTPVSPLSKMEVLDAMKMVKESMLQWKEMFVKNQGGKTTHPAFSYLSAKEWYCLIVMHWRHHIKQKIALDNTLKKVRQNE